MVHGYMSSQDKLPKSAYFPEIMATCTQPIHLSGGPGNSDES